MSEKKFKSLKDFYPFYLSQHTNTTSRVLHFIGTGLVALTLFTGFLFHQSRFFLALPFLAFHGLVTSFLRRINLLFFNIRFIR